MPAEADATKMGEEEANTEVGENGKQENATSALLVSRERLTGHQQKSVPTHAARSQPEAVGVSHLSSMPELSRSNVPVGRVVPFEPRLGDMPQTTSDGREAPSHAENESYLSVRATASTPTLDCPPPSVVPFTGESDLVPQQQNTLAECDTPRESGGAMSGGQVMPPEQPRSLLVPGKKAPMTVAMSSAGGNVTAENRTM